MAKDKTKSMRKTPTTELPKLWESSFFTEWRSATDVVAEFAEKGCHFGAPAVSNALARARFLTRKGKGRGLKYVQAYPFEEE
ncbi:MAG: hypothetical protein NUV84_02265 [Candidatus Uhrbacteria bacterium]|nr:hypothetical protein [Candidatus Uhrbacteria bacterium]